MVHYISEITFEDGVVEDIDDGLHYDALYTTISPEYVNNHHSGLFEFGDKFNVTTDSINKLTIGTGHVIAFGRMFKNEEIINYEINDASSIMKYAYMVAQIDLSQNVTQRCEVKIINSESDYPTLLKDDLNQNPVSGVYQYEIAQFAYNNVGIYNFVSLKQDDLVLGNAMNTVKKVNGVAPDTNGNVTLTKEDIGLGNVDNTSDLNKPISTATAEALNGKASTDIATPTTNGLLSGPDKAKLDGLSTGGGGGGGNVSATTENITYYVNPNGSDSNDGLTSSTPFKTVQKAIDMLPQIINHSVVINLQDGVYSASYVTYISGFSGKGSIKISSVGTDLSCTLEGNIQISSCTCQITVEDLGFRGSNGFVLIKTCAYVYISSCKFDDADTAVYVLSSSVVNVSNCSFYSLYTCISAEGSSLIRSYNNGTGSGNTTALRAVSSIIFKSGSQPPATTAESKTYGGQIW